MGPSPFPVTIPLAVPVSIKSSFHQNETENMNRVNSHPGDSSSVNGFDETFKFIMKDLFCGGVDNKIINGNNNNNNGHEIFEDTNFQELEDSMSESWEWLKTVMNYTVPNGKQIRGRLVELTFKSLMPDASCEMIKLSRILGWCVEILQASFLVADDIMDGGHLRRGQPCWHRVDNKGITALNDTFLLEHVSYQILNKYFRDLPCFPDLLDLFLAITFKTAMGQSLDTRSSLKIAGQSPDDRFSSFNVNLYNSIVRHKTSYYTCYLPVALAMCLAGIPRNNGTSVLWKKMEKLTLDLGHLFQVQDDFIDCFENERITGKVGMDIQEGKCTWLFVTAKEMLTSRPEVYQILRENYGKFDDNCVERVKQLYRELNLPNIMQSYQEQTCRNIMEQTRKLDHPELERVLVYFFDLIYKRSF